MGVLEEAKREGDYRLTLDAIDKAYRGYETIARITGEMKSGAPQEKVTVEIRYVDGPPLLQEPVIDVPPLLEG
jgi:hypothetical protein